MVLQIVVTLLYYFEPWLKNVDTHLFFYFLFLFKTSYEVRGLSTGSLTTIIFKTIIYFCWKFWTTHNFIQFFFYKNTHIFILMSSIIQCIIKKDIFTTWNFICNLIIFLLHVNCVELLLASSLSLWKIQWLKPTFECAIWVIYLAFFKKQKKEIKKPWFIS